MLCPRPTIQVMHEYASTGFTMFITLLFKPSNTVPLYFILLTLLFFSLLNSFAVDAIPAAILFHLSPHRCCLIFHFINLLNTHVSYYTIYVFPVGLSRTLWRRLYSYACRFPLLSCHVHDFFSSSDPPTIRRTTSSA